MPRLPLAWSDPSQPAVTKRSTDDGPTSDSHAERVKFVELGRIIDTVRLDELDSINPIPSTARISSCRLSSLMWMLVLRLENAHNQVTPTCRLKFGSWPDLPTRAHHRL